VPFATRARLPGARPALLIVDIATLLACVGKTGYRGIQLVAATARPGEASAYRIVNARADLRIPLRLERETSDGWVLMNTGVAFRLIGFGVLRGQAWELQPPIPTDAPAGVYRIRTSVTTLMVIRRPPASFPMMALTLPVIVIE
jgi:hypothetical protein